MFFGTERAHFKLSHYGKLGSLEETRQRTWIGAALPLRRPRSGITRLVRRGLGGGGGVKVS